MNKDQTKGRIEEVKGKVKEITGQVVGDKELEAKGKVQNIGGKAQADVWRCEGGPQESRSRQVKRSGLSSAPLAHSTSAASKSQNDSIGALNER